MFHSLNSKTGYTLIELLIVMSIIGALSIFAIPTYEHVTNKIAIQKMRTDLQVIDMAICTYTLTRGSSPESLSELDLENMAPNNNQPCPPKKIATYSLNKKKYEIDQNLSRSYVQLDDNTRFYSDSPFELK